MPCVGRPGKSFQRLFCHEKATACEATKDSKPAAKEKDDAAEAVEEQDAKLTQLLDESLELGDDASSMIRKTLCLLDMNGNLVYRDKNGTRGGADFEVPTGRYHSTRFFLRPFARELVCHLLNDPRCVIGVYTSIMAKNVRPVVQAFDTHFEKMSRSGSFSPVRVGTSVVSSHVSILENMVGLFDQPYNSPDPNGEKEWDTIRDLKKVWRCPKLHGEFGPDNTVVIDAEQRKVRNCLDNAIVVPEYTEAVMASRCEEESPPLKSLLKYLDNTLFPEMQMSKTATVPEILRRTPWTVS